MQCARLGRLLGDVTLTACLAAAVEWPARRRRSPRRGARRPGEEARSRRFCRRSWRAWRSPARPARHRRGTPRPWRNSRSSGVGIDSARASHSSGGLEPDAGVQLAVGPVRARPTPGPPPRGGATTRCASTVLLEPGRAAAARPGRGPRAPARTSLWSLVTSRVRTRRSRTRARSGSSSGDGALDGRPDRLAGVGEADHPQHQPPQLDPLGVGQALVHPVRAGRDRAADARRCRGSRRRSGASRPGAARSRSGRARAAAEHRAGPRRPGSSGRPGRARAAAPPARRLLDRLCAAGRR